MEVNDGEEKVEMGSGLWSELTQECLLDIFSRLSQEQRWIGPILVCKNWMNACYDPSLNTTFALETRFLSFPESINWWTPEFEDKVDSFFQSVVDGAKVVSQRFGSGTVQIALYLTQLRGALNLRYFGSRAA